jgi:uncharacterized phage protein (TIGR01671 family)
MKNRPIKFRVWNKKTNEWVHGPHKEPCLDGVNLFGETILLGAFMPVRLEELNDCIAVQYTGLKDIHGAELFEGDICKYEGDDGKSFDGAVIDFFWGSFRLNGDYIDSFIENEHAAAKGSTSLEKIGNAFENPELMKF